MNALFEPFERSEIQIVLHHAGCPDGYASAWVVHYYFKYFHPDKQEPAYLPVHYNKDPPYDNIKNKNVLICDFHYPRDIIDKMIESYKCKIWIIDHHKTANDELKDKNYFLFDITECGATLTWNWFFCNVDHPMPLILNYVKDRDLWKWEEPKSKEINTYLYNSEMHFCFDLWDQHFLNRSEKSQRDSLSLFADYGSIMLKQTESICKQITYNKRIVKMLNMNVAIFQSNVLTSEASDYVLKNNSTIDFTMAWRYDHFNREYNVSLRSKEVDVSEIAKKYFKGGGHKQASGFSVSGNIKSNIEEIIDVFINSKPLDITQ